MSSSQRLGIQKFESGEAIDWYDPTLRAYDNASTWLAETLNGSMRTSFEYQFDGTDLYSHDGGALKPIFRDGLNQANQLAEHQPNLVFELRRRRLESDEYQAMLAMAKAEKPNTMVVISDFPPELMEAKEDIGGYNTSRRQTMLRVINRQLDGSIRITTQTLDGSDRSGLEAIYAHFGLKPQPGELLGQRISLDLEPTEQANLVDQLVRVYDRQLNQLYGGWFRAGRSENLVANSYDFVKSQSDLLSLFVAESLKPDFQSTNWSYAIAATLTKRFEASRNLSRLNGSNPATAGPQLWLEISQASRQATEKGRIFSGCGGSFTSPAGQMKQSGYGNRTTEVASYKFNKKMYCLVCQAPPKKTEKPKMCGPCGICQSCDHKLQRSKAS